MSTINETGDRDPFELGGWNGESATGAAPNLTAQQDPVLAILPHLAEADARGKDGNDDGTDLFVDLQCQLGRVAATTLPGPRAHLKEFGRMVKDFDPGSVGAAHVAAEYAEAIEKSLGDGVTGASLPELQRKLAFIGRLIEGFQDDGTCGTWFDNLVEGFGALVESPLANERVKRAAAE